jgi:hypothetical protein
LSVGSSEITAALATLKELTSSIKNDYVEVLSTTEKLRAAMENLVLISKGTEKQEQKAS